MQLCISLSSIVIGWVSMDMLAQYKKKDLVTRLVMGCIGGTVGLGIYAAIGLI